MYDSNFLPPYLQKSHTPTHFMLRQLSHPNSHNYPQPDTLRNLPFNITFQVKVWKLFLTNQTLKSIETRILSQKWTQPIQYVVQYFDTLIDFYGRTFYGWNIEERRLCKGSFTNYIHKFWAFLTTLPKYPRLTLLRKSRIGFWFILSNNVFNHSFLLLQLLVTE